MQRRALVPFLLAAVAAIIAYSIATDYILTQGSSRPTAPEAQRGGKLSSTCIDGDFVADPSQQVVEISMSAYQWRFSYCSITVYEGQMVIIHVKSLDVPHGIAIDGIPGTNVFISPDAVSTVKFKATKKGEFTYFCIVFCGEGHPFHKGTLIVK